jgi:hypothetical protein
MSVTLLVSLKLSKILAGFNAKITIALNIANIAITIINSTKVNDFFNLCIAKNLKIYL